MSVKQPGMTNAEYLRVLRQTAAVNGKCYGCRKRPKLLTSRYCGICAKPRKNLAEIKYKNCLSCSASIRDLRRRQLCRRCRRSRQDWDRERLEARIADKMCTRCGKNSPVPNRKQCSGCAEKTRLRVKRLYDARVTARKAV